LKSQDALTILGYTGALLGTQHPELTVNKVNVTTDTRLTLTGFHKLLDPECHQLTRKHLILGVNHLNGRTLITPWLMHPLQYMDPEYHHTTYKHLSISLNHSEE
jgi:gentisate 1,2-dioxygenase